MIVWGCTSCVTFTRFYHDPDKAAAKAIVFAKEAFIDLNQPEAYGYLSQDLRRNLSFDQFINVIATMHPHKFPQVVVATEYEPVPGQKAVVIWLVGENESEKFDYRMVMVGTSPGYQVGAVHRVHEKSTSDLTKPLSVRVSTDDLP